MKSFKGWLIEDDEKLKSPLLERWLETKINLKSLDAVKNNNKKDADNGLRSGRT